jgi:hypothetical protein
MDGISMAGVKKGFLLENTALKGNQGKLLPY